MAEPGFDLGLPTVQGFAPMWNIYQLLHPEPGSMKDLTIVGIFSSLQGATVFGDHRMSEHNTGQDPAGHDEESGSESWGLSTEQSSSLPSLFSPNACGFYMAQGSLPWPECLALTSCTFQSMCLQ